MKTAPVTVVRVYLTEGKGQLKDLMECLHDIEKVRGVTVFRGISGFGRSGTLHSSHLLDLTSDLPLVIEFFDEPGKIQTILSHLSEKIGAGHIVSWNAEVNV